MHAESEQLTRRRVWLLFLIGFSPLFFNGWYNPFIAQQSVVYWPVEAATWIALPLIIFGVGFGCHWVRPGELGLRARVARNLTWPWLVVALVAVPLVMLAINPFLHEFARPFAKFAAPVFSYGQYTPAIGPGPTKTGWQGPPEWLQTLYFAFSAGIVEELYFRGLLRRAFANNLRGGLIYLPVSVVLFSVIHWEGGGERLAYSAFWGLFLGTAYLLLRNLWPVILGHLVLDLFEFGNHAWWLNFFRQLGKTLGLTS